MTTDGAASIQNYNTAITMSNSVKKNCHVQIQRYTVIIIDLQY